MTRALCGRRDLIVRQCRAAGLDVTEGDAMLPEMSALGIVFTALTTGVPQDTAGRVTIVRAGARSG
ncbi:hypothetical protein C1I98_07045 [Spongiactinospora gelatinilytica]|uniref:Uncharacterized protein n=1 Tax=Spongiactinospora gelatinilytica TaxID=2666298 RepID=A0A2W2GWY2_9ACTN|nr:hypothetical protein [Spongiactinospora gelatinilytica]PZG52243.1 hypothetical protein C1I98_07045 [Spongiactinospora gelatinilytica]